MGKEVEGGDEILLVQFFLQCTQQHKMKTNEVQYDEKEKE